MTLGPEDVESAKLTDLLTLFLAGGLNRRKDIVPGLFVLVRGVDRAQSALGHLCDREELGVSTKHDVSSTSGHIGSDGDGTDSARLSDNGRLAGVVLRVQDLVADAALGQHLREPLALFDARGSDQDRLAGGVTGDDVLDDLAVFCRLVPVNEVRVVQANHRLVGRNRHHTQLVGGHKLARLGLCRSGHAGELLIQPEVVLEGNRGESLVLRLDGHPLLGLDGLVDALVIPAAGQNTPGVLINDQDFTVDDDVVLVFAEQRLGLNGVVQERNQRGVGRLIEVVDAEVVFDFLDSRF